MTEYYPKSRSFRDQTFYSHPESEHDGQGMPWTREALEADLIVNPERIWNGLWLRSGDLLGWLDSDTAPGEEPVVEAYLFSRMESPHLIERVSVGPWSDLAEAALHVGYQATQFQLRACGTEDLFADGLHVGQVAEVAVHFEIFNMRRVLKVGYDFGTRVLNAQNLNGIGRLSQSVIKAAGRLPK